MKDVTPLLTVIMPVYNTERYLRTAIESILRQTFQDFEFVIVDDGSTDGSPAILMEYADQNPGKIRLFRQENQGAFPAYNKCIELAEGRYILTLNSDDYYTEDALAILASYVNAHDVDVVFVNVATHVADMDQKILKADHQSGVMQKDFVIVGQENVRRSWPRIMSYGLVRNTINLYRADIMKRHPFRVDHYGADFTYNIDIASEIRSAACHPKNLYQNFLYVGNDDVDRNISVGKYYPYEHGMFNEFFFRYKALFKEWGIASAEHANLLAQMRFAQLDTELINIHAKNNAMTYGENIVRLISYFDDAMAEVAAILHNRAEIEKKILDACRTQLGQAKARRIRDRRSEHPIARLIEAPSRSEKPLRARGDAMLDALFHEDNPYHLGLFAYESFCAQNPAAADSEALAYLQTEEQARAHILTGAYALAAEEVGSLFEMPFQEPEKYLLLGLNGRAMGFEEDAQAAFSLGLDMFPAYQRIVDVVHRA